MNEAEGNIGSFEDSLTSLLVAVIVALVIIALFWGLTTLIGVILVLGPGFVAIYKMVSYIKNIANKTGKFFIRVSNFVFSKKITTTNGSGWGMHQASDPTEKLPAGTVGTKGFTAGGNLVADPTLEAVNATIVSSEAHIGEVGNKPNYSASFPLGDPFQGPSYLVFGPLDEIKYTPFWLPVVEASEAVNAKEETKYLSLCPYSNPLYSDPKGLAGNSYDNPLIVEYDNSKNTPQYNYYGYVDSDENNGIGSSFGAINNGSFALDDALDGSIGVNASTKPDVSNSGAVRLSSNNAVWIKDMRTNEIRLVPFQTLNGQLRTSTADTSLKYEYIETTKLSEQHPVKDAFGNPVTATTSSPPDPLTGAVTTRIYAVTSEWTVTTGGKADVSAVLNLGFGLSPMEGYVLAKRTGLLINQDKIYAVPEMKGKFTVSGGYASLEDPSKAANFSYYHESPGAGIVIFNLRSTGSDALLIEDDKKAYYAQQKAWGIDQFNAWWAEEIKNGRGVTDSNGKEVPKIYNDFWVNIKNSDGAKPDFLIKETNEQFIVSMEYKPFTGDMIKYWAERMPGFTPETATPMGQISFIKDEGGWKAKEMVGEDGITYQIWVPDLKLVTPENGTSTSFVSKTAAGSSVTAEDFKKLYYNPTYFTTQEGIDSQGFNSKLGVKGVPNSSADSTSHLIVRNIQLNSGRIYADPFKDTPESFVSRFSNFNPFIAFANNTTPDHSISTPLFAFESGVETYTGVSSAVYTQFATYKTTGLHEGYTDPATGQTGTVMRTAGEPIKDLSTDKPQTEEVTLPPIKLPWGPNPISSAEVILPLTNEELDKYVSNDSKAFDAYYLPSDKPNFNGFDIKLSDEAKAFYKKIKGKINAESVFNTENLNYLPLMDKTKLQKYTATDALTGKPLPVADDRAVYPQYAENADGTKGLYLTEFAKAPASGNANRFITKYAIYKGTVAGGEIYFKTVPFSAFPFEDTMTMDETTYYYKVKAIYNNGEEEWSPEQAVTTKYPFPSDITAPLGFSARTGWSTVILTWNFAENAKWDFSKDFVEPSQVKKDDLNYKYIVTPKLPDDFAVFTKYISYSEGVDFNKSDLDQAGAKTGVAVDSEITPNSSSYESAFSYEVDTTTGLPKDKNKTDTLLASLYKIKQGDMNPDGTLTADALRKIEDPLKAEYISASKIGTFAIVNPSDYYQAPQEYSLEVTQDNIVNLKDPSEIPVSTPVQPPSVKDLSVFKGFPQGSPLGGYNTCVTGAFGVSGDYTAATGVSFHAGIDLSTGGVSQPIYSTLNGVVKLGTTINGGNVIEIWSSYTGADGKKYFVRVRFCHTDSSVLSDGDEVKAGDLVGYSGNSGTPFGGMGVSSYAYHLHYEIRISSVFADLQDSLKSAVNPLDPQFGISGTRICY